MARKHIVPAILTICLAAAGSAFMVPASTETAEASDPIAVELKPPIHPDTSGYGVYEVAFGSGEQFDHMTREVCEFMAEIGIGKSETLTVNGRDLPSAQASAACTDGGDNVVVIGSVR